jgi:putative transposase
MARTYTNLLIHVTFSTSYRVPLLTDAIRPDVHAYLGGILRELGAIPIAIGGTADHVHLLTRLPANLALADCLRVVKTNSSRWVKSGGLNSATSPGKEGMELSASANPGGQP